MTHGERVLITGSGGMLGKAVHEKTIEKYGADSVRATDIDLNESWLTMLDVRDIRAYEQVVTDWKPTIIFHLAALTDLEYCEKNVLLTVEATLNRISYLVQREKK